MILGMIYFALVPAAITAVLLFALRKLTPAFSDRVAIVVSSLAGAVIPSALPVAVILLADGDGDSTITLVVFAVLTAIVAIVICFPAAWLMNRRLPRRNDAVVFE